MTAPRKKLTRFRRDSYAGKNTKGDVPKWHIATHDYLKARVYPEFTALCGYTIEWPQLSDTGVRLSKAVRVSDSSPHCSTCKKRQAELDAESTEAENGEKGEA